MTLNKVVFLIRDILLITALLFSSSSCTQKKKISGREFIPREDLVSVLTDMYLIDGITNDIRFYRKFNPGDSIDMFTNIFEKYNITREKYEHTINEYSKYPALLDKVYDEVLMQLNLMLEKEENEPKTGDHKIAPRDPDAPIK